MCSSSGFINDNEFKRFFKVVHVPRDGNCLFHTLAHFTDFTHNVIRKWVSDFYLCFVKNKPYKEGTLEYAIVLSNTFDNLDDDDSVHEKNIGNNNVWANMTDVLVASLLFDLNICLVIPVTNDLGYITKYRVENIEFNKQKKKIYVLFSGENHFEPLNKCKRKRVKRRC